MILPSCIKVFTLSPNKFSELAVLDYPYSMHSAEMINSDLFFSLKTIIKVKSDRQGRELLLKWHINRIITKGYKMYNAVDLFAGVGGLSLGLKMAGITSEVAVEFDDTCADALLFNFPNTQVIHEDIKAVSASQIQDMLGEGTELDILAGGPPCQGFSLIGLRDPNDERSRLVFEFIRLAQELKPKFIMLENVPGILSSQKGAFIEEVVQLFKKAGYLIRLPIQVLSAANFGVPQDRRRAFILGVREDIGVLPDYPEATHLNPRDVKKAKLKGLADSFPNLPTSPNVMEAIEDLPNIDIYPHLVESDEVEYCKPPVSGYAKMMRGVSQSAYSGLPKNNWDGTICSGSRRTVHGEVLTKRFIEAKQGDTVPVSRLFKLREDCVANTLRAGTPRERGAYSAPRPVHPHLPRVVSVREGARLQSFPDWHRFHKTKWHGFRQVGNAVPPLLARAVALEIKKTLDSLELNRS